MAALLNQQSPLTKTRRRVIFYLAILLFLLLTPIVVFYSLGYGFDLETNSVIRTGGIFIKTNQNNFKLFVNDRLAKENSLLSYGALVTNLKPDLYSVKVEKDDFRPWQRVIHVSPEEISEFRFVLLIPETVKEKEVLNTVKRNIKIKWIKILEESPWILARAEEKKSIVYLFNRNNGIFDAVETFTNLRWNSRDNHLLVRRSGPTRFALINLNSGRVQETQLRIPKKVGAGVMADFTDNSDELFILGEDNTLYRFNRVSKAIKTVLSDVHSFSVVNNRLLFVTQKGFFYSANLQGEEIENYGRKGFYLTERPAQMNATEEGNLFLIDSAGGFFVRRKEKPEVTPISGNVVGAEFTVDGDKLLFWSDKTIEVMWLTDETHAPFHRAGDRERILSLGDQTFNHARWFGTKEEHIIFSAGKFIGIADIDSRGGGPTAAIVFDKGDGIFDYDAELDQILRADESFIYVSSF